MACTCPIRPGMTYRELMDEVFSDEQYCTSAKSSGGATAWVCENALRHLEKARADERSFTYRKRSLKKQGYTEEQIQKMPRRKRRKAPTYAVAMDLDLDGILS